VPLEGLTMALLKIALLLAKRENCVIVANLNVSFMQIVVAFKRKGSQFPTRQQRTSPETLCDMQRAFSSLLFAAN
jgi:hypothetical protein